MKDLGNFTRIFVAQDAVDFRKQARGLVLLVQEGLGLEATKSKSLFVFTNKRRDAIKLLYWDETGFALWWKILEKDCFHWLQTLEGRKHQEITTRELRWLLDGVNLSQIKTHKKLQFG